MVDQRTASIQKATESVHEETVRIVDAQMKDMGRQMEALDDFVAKARSQNGRYHEAHLGNLNNMATGVRESYSAMHGQLHGLDGRVVQLQKDATQQEDILHGSTAPLSEGVRQPLSELRANVQGRPVQEYKPTGATPKKRKYEYPSALPQTEKHDALVSRLRNSKELTALPFSGEQLSPLDRSPTASPSKQFVYNDADEVGTEPSASTNTASNTGLREVDANVVAGQLACDDTTAQTSLTTPLKSEEDGEQPPLKRHCSTSAAIERKVPKAPTRRTGRLDGRENIPPSAGAVGRRLRGRPSG